MASEWMHYSVYEPLILGSEKEEECPSNGQTKQQQHEDFYSASHHPCSYHIEDIQNVTADELNPIISSTITSHPTSSIPDLLISHSSSPDILTTMHDTWGNADEIPTRVPSAALDEEEFPPLMRCSNNPAMGWYPDDFILDTDYYDADADADADDDYDEGYSEDDSSLYDDSVVSEWCSFLRDADNGDAFGINLFCCQQQPQKQERIIDLESKDDETWSVVSQSQASSAALPSFPPPSRSCTLSSNLRVKAQSDWTDMTHVPAPMPVL